MQRMRAELLKGHTDLFLLHTLEAGPAHGYRIIELLRERSGGELDLPEGTIYPALHRLERVGAIRGRWDESGPRATACLRADRQGTILAPDAGARSGQDSSRTIAAVVGGTRCLIRSATTSSAGTQPGASIPGAATGSCSSSRATCASRRSAAAPQRRSREWVRPPTWHARSPPGCSTGSGSSATASSRSVMLAALTGCLPLAADILRANDEVGRGVTLSAAFLAPATLLAVCLVGSRPSATPGRQTAGRSAGGRRRRSWRWSPCSTCLRSPAHSTATGRCPPGLRVRRLRWQVACGVREDHASEIRLNYSAGALLLTVAYAWAVAGWSPWRSLQRRGGRDDRVRAVHG